MTLSISKRDHLGIGPLMVIIHCLSLTPLALVCMLYVVGSTCIQIISLFDNSHWLRPLISAITYHTVTTLLLLLLFENNRIEDILKVHFNF